MKSGQTGQNDLAMDSAGAVRRGEGLNLIALKAFLRDELGIFGEIEVLQFPKGHSNLTYLLKTEAGRQVVLRRPPVGANIPSGHDMGREFRILSTLHPHWPKVPRPLAYCADKHVLGAPFYLMERVEGVILRTPQHPGLALDEKYMGRACTTLVSTLVEIHGLDLQEIGMTNFGRPDGYIQRQVDGSTKRYHKAKTHEVPEVEEMARWLAENQPESGKPAVIHNDYKYDNLVLDCDDPDVAKAVLDWEMCTVADPLMDLGTTLAYWVDPEDPAPMHTLPFGPTVLPGNLRREALVDAYVQRSGRAVDDPVFYYVYGLFKVAGIAQQIYGRFHHGVTTDPRFAKMIDAVRMMGRQGRAAILADRISCIGAI